MPIYEYRCNDCSGVTSVFVRSARKKVKARCEHCDSAKLTRMMSRVNRTKTEQDVLDELGVPGAGGRPEDAYKDPRQIGPLWTVKATGSYNVSYNGLRIVRSCINGSIHFRAGERARDLLYLGPQVKEAEILIMLQGDSLWSMPCEQALCPMIHPIQTEP